MTPQRANGWWPWSGIFALLVLISLGHYLTTPSWVLPHNLFRRLYYLPIVWASFTGGLRFGLLTALLVTVAYIPHAFLLPHHLDPAGQSDKVIEIAIYFGVGALAGLLVDRERRARHKASRAQIQRLAAEQDAKRLQGLVHLTRGLAHEIRNPLGSIQGAVEILEGAVPEDRPEREMITITMREVARLNRVLTDFLSFARPRPPELRPVAVDALLRHVIGLYRDEAARAAVRLSVEDARGLWAVGDRDQLTQVLINLVSNAIAACPDGGEVSLRADRVSDAEGAPRVQIRVADTGVGIPEGLGSSIYDPYVTRREGGTGLGLSIAALIVKHHGGLLSHEARAGGGTVFGFSLPSTSPPASA